MTSARHVKSAAPRTSEARIRFSRAPVPFGRSWIERMKSFSCPGVMSMSGAPCEQQRLGVVGTVGAEIGDDVGDRDLGGLRLEEELPEPVVAGPGQAAAQGHRQEPVRR